MIVWQELVQHVYFTINLWCMGYIRSTSYQSTTLFYNQSFHCWMYRIWSTTTDHKSDLFPINSCFVECVVLYQQVIIIIYRTAFLSWINVLLNVSYCMNNEQLTIEHLRPIHFTVSVGVTTLKRDQSIARNLEYRFCP